MKKCFKCKIIKNLQSFYKHPGMADGHLGKCKLCTKKDVKNRYKNNYQFIKNYEKLRRSCARRKAKMKIYQQKSSKKYKSHIRARWKLNYATKTGKIKKIPCVICGDRRSQGHHLNYKKPLIVKWLCDFHHKQEHRRKSFVVKDK